MLDKIILVHYIHIGTKSPQKAREVMHEVINLYQPKPEDADKIISYWIPIREGESRVECIYPKFAPDQDWFDKAFETLSLANDRFKFYTKIMWEPSAHETPSVFFKIKENCQLELMALLNQVYFSDKSAATLWKSSNRAKSILDAFGVKYDDVYIKAGENGNVELFAEPGLVLGIEAKEEKQNG